MARIQGTVAWFNNTRGFGFLSHHGGPDVFVHYSSIQGEGYKRLDEGAAVEFEIESGPTGRPQAAKVTLVQAS